MAIYTAILPNGQPYQIQGPEGASAEDIQAAGLQLYTQRNPAPFVDSGKRDYTLGQAASKGLSRGTERIKSAFGDVIPAMVGDALGFDEYAAKQMKEAQASQELVNRKYRAELQSYKDVQGIGDAIKFGIETVSEQIPNLATMVVPGIGAGQIARVGASKLAATELAKRQATAQGIGVYMGSYALNTPEVFQNIYDETGELATGTAILFGAAAAALDSVLPSAVLKNITPFQKSAIAASVLRKSGTRPGITKSVLTGIGKGSGAEGLTEAAQEAISISAENFVGNNPQIFDSEDWDRIMESAVRGAVAGGTFRGISEPFGRSRAEPKNVEDLTQSDVLDENIKIAATADVAKETAEENMKKVATAAPLAEVAKAAPAAEVTPKVKIVPNRLKTLRKNNLINQQAAQAAELGLEIQEDGTATRFETVDPQDETAGEQEVTYKIINNRWERQDESTTIDATDGIETPRGSNEVPIQSESTPAPPPSGESDRREVGVDTDTVSPTGGGENVSDAALDETVEQQWTEMSDVPFAELSTENKAYIKEAKEDLGITGELVAQVEQNEIQNKRIEAANARVKGATGVDYSGASIGPVDTQESRAETEGTGQTAETVTTELVEEFGNNVNKTIEKGKLVIIDDVSQLPDNVTMSSTANGAFDKKSGISYLVASRIQKGQARRILLHEIGEHYGLEKMVGKDYMSLLNRLKTLRKQNADVDAIFAQVQEQYPELKVNSKPFLQEVMAKVGESAPNNTLFRRIVGAVKNFLRGLGLYNVNNFNDADIQDMILNSLRVSLAEATGTVTREQASGIPALQMSKEAPSIIDLGGVNVQESRAVMNAINPTIQNFKNADTAAGNFIFSNLSKIPDAAANLYVRFLSIPNKIELFGKQIPGLETILNALQGKANEIKQAREEVNRTIKIGQEILGRYSEEVQTEWNTILLELSRQNVNPETIINDPEARAELERPVGKDNAGNQFYNDKAIDLVARYEQLPKDLRDLAKLLVSDLKLKYDTLLETMIATYPGAEAQLRERFASLDYYLPMVRKGNFWFKYIDKNGEEASSSAETSFLRERMKKKLAEEGAKKFEDFTQAQLAAVSGRAPSEFVENLKAVFETSELDAGVKQSIVDTIEDQYLALFPEQSLRNQESHRRGVPGYINDVLFAYGETAPKIIASTANARYNTEIVAAANQVSSETKDSTSAIVRAIGKDTINTTPFYLNPVANIFASMPAYLSYVWFIGGNISSAFVNLTQLPLIVLPFLQGEYGFDESQKALFDAIKMYSNGGFEENRDFLPDRTMAPFKKGKNGKRIYRDKEFAPNGKYHQLFKDAEEAAALRRGVGYEITELRKSLGAQVKSGAQWQTKAEAAVGYVFQNSERLNREVTLIAAFNLAKNDGLSDKDAIQKAIDLTSKVHSHALPEVGPSLFQDGLGKVTFVFKRFAQAQVYLVSKLFKDVFATKPKTEKERKERNIARDQLLGVYGYSFLMAGVQGMPFYGGATILASLLFDDEDDPFDPHTAVNQAIGNIAYRGPLSAVLGVDISQRTGFRDLVFREDPARLEKIGASAYMLEVIGGPGYSIARRGFEGIEMIGNGEIGRGAERILPTAVGNALKTVRYNTDGMTNRYGAPIIEGNPSVYESFMQILGFSNIELSEAYTESNALKGPERKLQKRRSQLLLQYFLAKQTGDVSGMKSIQKDINRFNSKAPRSFKLTPSVMNKSFKARTERVKNSVQGTYISSKRRADLEDKYLPD